MRAVRHRYECPLRWADLDLLGHVNNVKYVDYLQEARGALLRSCAAAAGVSSEAAGAYVVVRHEITFAAPLLFRRPSVSVDSWVSQLRTASFTLDHEIYDEQDDGSRTVYLRARTVLAPVDAVEQAPRRLLPTEREALAVFADDAPAGRGPSQPLRLEVPRAHAAHYPVQVRFSDLDIYRHVNNVKYVEYFQESRIALFRRLREPLKDFPRLNVVVAQTDLDYIAPITLREEPYDAWTSITAFGTKSMTIDAEITDGTGGAEGGTVLSRARVVLVLFDLETQRSVAAPPGYREAVLAAFGVTP